MKSSIRHYVGRGTNRLLRPLGLKIGKASRPAPAPPPTPARVGVSEGEYNYLKEKYREAVNEIHGFFRASIFPDLPALNGRLELVTELTGTQVSEAMYLLEYLISSLALPGDVCEFGVARGTTSALLANEMKASDKCLWLFDSFKGLPKPTAKDVLVDDIYHLGTMGAYEGEMKFEGAEVLRRLKGIGFPTARTRVIDGYIEETIQRAELPGTVCFAYVDFDFYQPIATALEFLNEHLTRRGTIVVDDYGFFSAGAQTAVDEFLALHPVEYEVIHPYAWAGHFVVLQKK